MMNNQHIFSNECRDIRIISSSYKLMLIKFIKIIHKKLDKIKVRFHKNAFIYCRLYICA